MCHRSERSGWHQTEEQLCAHTRERSGVGRPSLVLRAGPDKPGGPKQESCEPNYDLELRLGSISGAELAATCEVGREIGTASSEGGTDCVGSQARVQITSTSTRSERSVRFRQVDNLRKITVESGNFGWIICGRCRQEMCCSWEGTRIATISASFYGSICDCSDYARVTRGSRATRNAHMIRLVESFHLQKKMPD